MCSEQGQTGSERADRPQKRKWEAVTDEQYEGWLHCFPSIPPPPKTSGSWRANYFLEDHWGSFKEIGQDQQCIVNKPEECVWGGIICHIAASTKAASVVCSIILLNVDLRGRHMWALIYKKQILSSALYPYCFCRYWDLCLSVESVIAILLFHKQCLTGYSPVT